MSETATKRRGCIRISADMQEHLGNPTTPQEWHDALLLPDRYVIERIERHIDTKWDVFNLWVLSEDIPEIASPMLDGIHVSPHYRQDALDEDMSIRTVSLARIDFGYWDEQHHGHTITGNDESNPRSRKVAVKMVAHAALVKSDESEAGE